MNTPAAYRECEAITRATAANFYYGIRLLGPERRRAMCAVYAFARRVDDIGDGPLEPAEKLRRLDAQARALDGLLPGAGNVLAVSGGAASGDVVSGGAANGGAVGEITVGETAAGGDAAGGGIASGGAAREDAVMIALGDACVRYAVPPDALRALIAGVRMDVEEVRYERFEELLVYCRNVAGAVGRACLAIFALREPTRTDRAAAQRLADDLGVALQLTNILRDLREDAALGRVYLPAEELRRFGVPGDPTALASARGEPLEALVGFQAERAREWFERGLALAPLLERRSAACLLAMAGIYGRLLARIEADPGRVLRERVALSAREKAWVAVRSTVRA